MTTSLDFLAHLRLESARFGAALRDTDPAARVPTCPDWNAGDLLYHLAEVFQFWATVVAERADDPGPIEAAKPVRPDSQVALLALYERCTAMLLDTLEATPDEVPVWTWSADHSVGFVRRRMAHEALIHRLDAELTAGGPTPVDPALATDGVDELLQHFFAHPHWAEYHADGPLARLRTTDTGATWLVQLGGFSGRSPDTGNTYDHEPCLWLVASGEPSFTMSETARDLDAWLWSRPTVAEPTIEGDRTAFQSFAAFIAEGIV
jgi:uncharacterized protein (TIGR03083 family)